MLLDEMFRLMDKWGKFVGLLSAIAGLVIIFVGKDVVAWTLILIAFFLIELWLLGVLRQGDRMREALSRGMPAPAPIYTGTQIRAAQWAITVVLILTIGLAVRLIWTYTYQASIQVFSARYPFTSTGDRVNASDRVEITVVGQNPQWNCGRNDSTGPEGYPNERYSDTVFEQENVCALIGSISPSAPEVYFLVGSHVTFTAVDSGMLYLGCNDSIEKPADGSTGRFVSNPTDSKLDVEVTVVRWLNIIPILFAFVALMIGGIALIPKVRRWVFPY